jgi:hypothetical protein
MPDNENILPFVPRGDDDLEKWCKATDRFQELVGRMRIPPAAKRKIIRAFWDCQTATTTIE